MMIKLLSKGLLALFLICGFYANSQNFKKIDYSISEIPKANTAFLGTPQIQATDAKFYEIDIDALKNQLIGIMHREHENSGFVAQISFPHPDGSMHEYNAKENSTMHPDLSASFSEIKTYDGHGLTNGAFVKWDITQHGLHAMIMIPGESTIFIDPVIKGNKDYYIVYSKKNFITDKLKDCSFDSDTEEIKNKSAATSGTLKSFGTCELRTYRLALSATGEYTTFHGGTVALALAAQVTTMNRVNGVYEKDMAITMVIIPNNNLIVYTNSGTDPFTNGNPGTMINQNQSNTDAVIGNGNYDIGHVFGTNSGGLAGLGVVCNNTQKARGVTGSAAPIGDPFDIDYVAHEMGHQFGGNHTFNNSCGGNRNNATAIEPGSGTTIMAYAGICPPDIQNNSDDHFSGKSLEEIGNEILSAGHTCEVITALANSAPILLSTNGNVTVPASTPFALTANATDADGDPMTFNWEQMDNGISTQSPVATSTIGPNFRSISSLSSPTRYFPNLVDLNAGGPFTWEVLPSVTRTMNFRVTVRDNSSGAGGCNDHADITLSTDAGSGPFIVNYPSVTGIIWAGASTETVTWSVANTDNAPVACGFVDILLSTDGGLTFPTILASGVANDGSQLITVPNIATTTAVVMVICSNGTFFDISDNNFEITMATFDYTLNTSPTTIDICQPSDAVYTVSVGSIGGYNDPVTLSVSGVPAGATSNFSVNPVTPVGTSDLTISNTGAAAPGVYSITITANSTTGIKTNIVTLNIASSNPSAVSQISPLNGATGVPLSTTFTWTSAPESGVTYEIDIAADAGFVSMVDQATGLASPSYVSALLATNTTYYWRVRAVTGCGSAAWSSTFDFTTENCASYSATDVPIAISASGTPTITSTINVPVGGTINDVNVLNLIGTHTWINDLIVTLQSPLGTSVTLWSQVCNNENNFDLNFDDAATPGGLPCPPVGGGTYQPNTVLSAFNGEDAAGNWVLTIQDMANQDGGSLASWTLQLCVSPPACVDPDVATISGITTICNGASTTLAIATGNLNGATDWQWYEGSCGGTVAGTGNSIIISPTANTSYFIRGEGGCVVPGVCQQVDVIVNPVYNTADAATICNGDSYIFGTQTLTTAGSYTEVFTAMNGCDSTVILTLTVNPTFNEIASATICNGDSYIFGTQTLSAAGSYTEVFTAMNGCDSTVILTLTVNPTFNEIASATICNGDSYIFGTQTLTAAGSYTELFTSTGGCDSTVILTLTVNPTYSEIASTTICNGDSYIFGTQTLTAAGSYTEVFTAMIGCDSTVILTLTVNPTYSETASAIICNGDSYIFGTQTLTAAGSYTEVFTAMNGCDSTVILALTVNPTFNESATAGICNGDSYIFGTQTLTAAGTYTEIFTSVNGCDSSVILNLSIITAYNETASATICSGDSYFFGTQTLTASGSYTELFTSTGGCDSTVILTLTVNPTYNESASATICNGDSYSFGAQTLTTGGSYTELFTSTGGCDSIVVLTLTVNPTYNETAAAGICNGDSYTFGTQTLTTAGTYTEIFISVNGCDSTVILNLSIITAYNETASATICNGDSYFFGTQTLTASGSYTELFTSTGGCDSTVVLALTVNPSYNESVTASICSGDSYILGTQTLTTTGTYTEVFTSMNGCDSTVVLGLNVNAAYNESATASICSGDSYTFGTQTLATAGSYTELFTSTGGCDSTVVLTLVVNPTYTFSENAMICQGDSYTFPDGVIANTTQSHTSSLTTLAGCDSIIVTNLTVMPTFINVEDIEICQGNSYTFPDGVVGTLTEAHTSVLTTINGCDSIIVTALTVHPSYNLNESATICEGEVYTFPDGNTGTTTQSYTSLLSTVNGCDSVIVTDLNVQIIDISVTENGKTLTANQSAASYQWIDCDNNNDPIVGETGQSFTATQVSGNYAVIVTIGNCSDTSACYLIDMTGIVEFNPESISIYPNPASDMITIDWQGTISMIEVTDVNGKLLRRISYFNDSSYQLELAEYSSGVYFIHVESEYGRTVFDIVKL